MANDIQKLLKGYDPTTQLSDDQLQKLWKHAVLLSLGPENIFPAFKIYYILLRKEIIERHLKFTTMDKNAKDDGLDPKEKEIIGRYLEHKKKTETKSKEVEDNSTKVGNSNV